MNKKIIGNKIVHIDKVTSTNSYARKILMDKIPEGTVILADIQTKGKGRKGRYWHSPEGGLWFSVILYPNIPPDEVMKITMTASISIAQILEQTVKIDPRIKWPNDILINGKKICGILTEVDAKENKINYCIVGIGLNTNNKLNEELKDIAISIKELTDQKISNKDLLQKILKNFNINYTKLQDSNFKDIQKIWNNYAQIVGKKIQVIDDDKELTGIVTGVNDNGALILDTNNRIKLISTGDLTFL